ncbi:hypothetical protein ACO1O0_008828 [Amphichorda felina]
MSSGLAGRGSFAVDSVGTLLAAIANLITEGLRILSFSDKRQWGQDEHEQVRALEDALDEARKDFQELGPLVNGQLHYETDRTHASLQELRALRDKFHAHASCLKDWSRSGGPIDPIWVRDTHILQRDLHRAQYRAARRIFTSGQESSARCLGAFLVYRKQRAWSNRQVAGVEEGEYQKRYLEELQTCNRVGTFQRFGEQDIAFVCDFCDGHLIWEDLERMPSVRTAHEDAAWPSSPVSPTTGNPQWQATGFSFSKHEEKQVVFAPEAIANHIAPHPNDWQARLLCPLCEDEAAKPQDKDDEEDIWRPENTFDDIVAFQEHLEWEHTATPTPVTPSTNNCNIM